MFGWPDRRQAAIQRKSETNHDRLYKYCITAIFKLRSKNCIYFFYHRSSLTENLFATFSNEKRRDRGNTHVEEIHTLCGGQISPPWVPRLSLHAQGSSHFPVAKHRGFKEEKEEDYILLYDKTAATTKSRELNVMQTKCIQ